MPRSELTAWIQKRIRDGKPGERFPSDAELARQFQTGITSVKTILKDFKTRGLITRVRNRGTSLPVSSEPDTPELLLNSPGRLAQALRSQFAQGKLMVGQFVPKVDFLCARYGVSPRTVCAALRELSREGIIQRSGRSYLFGSPQRRPSRQAERSEVWLVADKSTGPLFSRGGFAAILQSLEQELLRWGYLFRPKSASDLSDFFARMRSSQISPAGLIIWGNLDRAAVTKLLPDISSALRGMKTQAPRVILDCYRNYGFPKVPGVALFARQELVSASGREMIRYLSARKKRALFCYPAGSPHYQTWPAMRYDAMLAAQGSIDAASAIPCISVPGISENKGTPPLVTPTFEGYCFSKNECQRALALSPLFERCCAVQEAKIWICANDILAGQALCWLALRGIRVPRDIEVVGFDHDPGLFPLGITSYDPDFQRFGYLLAHFIMNDIPVYTNGNAVSCTGKVYEKLTSK